MTVVCWSVKGGSGTTVVAATLGALAAERGPTLLVDLAGDVATVLGVPEPDGPGVLDWLTARPEPAPGSLGALARPIAPDLRLVAAGSARSSPVSADWIRLAEALGRLDGTLVVDAGLGVPPAPLLAVATASLLVLRPCFLGLRHAARVPPGSATGLVVVTEPGRALDATDVGRVVSVPIVAEVPLDPAVARAVDSGLLLGRLPSTMRRCLRSAA